MHIDHTAYTCPFFRQRQCLIACARFPARDDGCLQQSIFREGLNVSIHPFCPVGPQDDQSESLSTAGHSPDQPDPSLHLGPRAAILDPPLGRSSYTLQTAFPHWSFPLARVTSRITLFQQLEPEPKWESTRLA